jgi:mxaJ protein
MALLTLPAAAWCGTVLRVCADPNNLPFSNRAGQGLENRLAALLASDLGMKVEYVWWTQRKNFVEKSLDAGVCDVIMGVPAALESVAVTRPYYRSIYVWVQRQNAKPVISSLYDERLAKLRIGVHVVDDAYAPPGQLLAHNGLAANLVSFSLYGSAAESNPPAKLVGAVARGDVDVALAWGPLAGYFADESLAITPVEPQRFGMVPFAYDIAVAVRPGDEERRSKLDAAMGRQCAAIQALLREYKVPQVMQPGESEQGGPLCASVLSASAWRR